MADEFPYAQYKNVGLGDENDPSITNATIGNIFQTATGTYTPNTGWYADPSWANVAPPVGGTMFGNAGGGGIDPNAWEDFISMGGYGTGGSLPIGGPGITTLPPVATSTSSVSGWGTTIGAGLAAGGLPGVLGAVGGRLIGGLFTGSGAGASSQPPIQMGPYVVNDSTGNQVPSTNAFNPPVNDVMGNLAIGGPGITVGPGMVVSTTKPTATQTESGQEYLGSPVGSDWNEIARQEAIKMAAFNVNGQPYLGSPIGSDWNEIARQAAIKMAPFNVNANPNTISSGTAIGGGMLKVPSQTNINQIYDGPKYKENIGPGDPLNTPPVSTGGPNTGSASGTGYTAPTVGSPAGRNYFNEGRQTLSDLQNLMPGITALYGSTAQGAQAADLARLQGAAGGIGGINQDLTGMAAAQTAAANSALRAGNMADAQKYAQQALDLRRQTNPELYAGLSQYQTAAGNQVTSDLAKLQQAQTGQLSPEDLRNAQQAAREAYAARGLVMGKGAIGAEILNRDALARQREQTARTNLGTSLGQLYQGIGAQTANVFDPMAATLGQQYGMQTGNVGMNQNLFNQSAGLASGAYGNQYAQQMSNPFNPYAQDVYNTNFNAAAAKDIAAMNNAAAIEASKQSANATTSAANTALWTNLIGGLAKGVGAGFLGK
jgi:hypothetical protein